MTYALRLFTDQIKTHQLDITEELPHILFNDRLYIRINDSICFDNVREITNIVKYLLLNTSIYFEINKGE